MHDAREPMFPRLVVRLSRALVVGIALFWLGAIVLVRGDGGVPAWWLPVALAGGFLVPPPVVRATDERPATFAWWALLGAALGVALVAIGYGAVATPSRHWDGAASFDAKVAWLVAAPTLQQPFFAWPEVFHHAPDYPLSMPLLVAATERWLGGGLGRLWLPVVWLLLLANVATSAWRGGVPRRVVRTLVLVVGLTPALLGPGGGAVDSGYADPMLLLATTLVAAGLWLRAPLELGLGVLLAVAAKPEGAVYAGLALGVAFVQGQRRSVSVAGGALLLGLAVWLPTQHQLLHLTGAATTARTAAVWLGLPTLVGVLLGVDALANRTGRPTMVRGVVAVVGLVGGFLALPWLATLLPADSSLGVYVHRGADWQRGMAALPAFLGAFAEYAVLRVQFGCLFVASAVAAVAGIGRRAPFASTSERALGWFVAVGLVSTALPFVFTPEADVRHHLRSSLPRLLLHWLGPAALFVGLRLATAMRAQPADDAGAAERSRAS